MNRMKIVNWVLSSWQMRSSRSSSGDSWRPAATRYSDQMSSAEDVFLSIETTQRAFVYIYICCSVAHPPGHGLVMVPPHPLVVDAPYDLCNMRCMITCYNVMIFTLYMLYHATPYAMLCVM